MCAGVGLEWVCGIGETLECEFPYHYKDRPTSLFYLRTCEDQEFASHKMMSSLHASTPLETNLSALLRKDLKESCAPKALTSPHQHCLGDMVSRHNQAIAPNGVDLLER
jgi:hypothetical protein